MNNIRSILTKKPFTRINPLVREHQKVTTAEYIAPAHTTEVYDVIPQEEFLKEYYPTGHKINSDVYYPDKVKYDDRTKQYFKERVFRASFPFQQIITAQQLVHLCGNDVHLELTGAHNSKEEKETMFELRKGWLDKNIEIAFYRLAASVKSTGDGAVVFFIDNGSLGWKSLSFANGDTLYPHYNSITGKLDVFARQYYSYDAEGERSVSWVEIWDDTFFYRYKQSMQGFSGTINKVLDYFGLEGFVPDGDPVRHQFNEIPVVYKRDDNGPCWSQSQDSIDKYELAVSHLCQNNMAYAFPIMLLKGDDVEIKGDVYGAVKAITMGQDDDVKYLAHDNGSESFKLQLDTLLKMIFLGSFTVQPPEVKSGDLPGVAIKLIYSPSIDKAMIDSKEYDEVIDSITKIFKFGYGIERKMVTRMQSLGVFAWIEPYVHQNQSELVSNLVQLVNANLLSTNTGSELTGYGENNEFDKIMTEYKEKQAADLLYELGNEQERNIRDTEREPSETSTQTKGGELDETE